MILSKRVGTACWVSSDKITSISLYNVRLQCFFKHFALNRSIGFGEISWKNKAKLYEHGFSCNNLIKLNTKSREKAPAANNWDEL